MHFIKRYYSIDHDEEKDRKCTNKQIKLIEIFEKSYAVIIFAWVMIEIISEPFHLTH
jgi:hypothetical protein